MIRTAGSFVPTVLIVGLVAATRAIADAEVFLVDPDGGRCVPMGSLTKLFHEFESKVGPCDIDENANGDFFTIACAGAPKNGFGSKSITACKVLAKRIAAGTISVGNPSFNSSHKAAVEDKEKLFSLLCGKLATSLNLYRAHVGIFPTTSEGLKSLAQTSGSPRWRGPYTELTAFDDPWGNPIVYIGSGSGFGDDYIMGSHGPDGKYETGDDLVCRTPK